MSGGFVPRKFGRAAAEADLSGGGFYRVGTYPGGSAASIERVVRSFVDIDSQPINRIFRRPDPAPDTPEAQITWGASSQFIFPPQAVPGDTGDDGTGTGGGGFTITWPTYGVDDPEEGDPIVDEHILTEVSRVTSDKRVENPTDSEQYVIIQRIDKLVMADNLTGETITWVFNNPP